jgi:hypothetical protein
MRSSAVINFPTATKEEVLMTTQVDTDVSDRVLEETPARATTFLVAVGASPELRAILAHHGRMSERDLEQGRQLLLDVIAVPPAALPSFDSTEAIAQRAALAEVDQWDEPTYQRASAALRRFHPSAAEYLFRDLAASRGAAAVHGALTFLTRIDTLEAGTDPERAATRDDDKKAVELLASRGIDRAERIRVRDLATLAIAPTKTPVAPVASPNLAKRRETLLALRKWFEDWSATAHAVVRKRQHLIRLGLSKAKRRARRDEPVAPAPAAPFAEPNR